MVGPVPGDEGMESGYSSQPPNGDSGFFAPPSPFADNGTAEGSRDSLVNNRQSSATLGARSAFGAKSIAPTMQLNAGAGDYGLGPKGDDRKGVSYYGELDPELAENKVITTQAITPGRRAWVAFVWALTFWIPSPALHYIGRMKRPDVRMAWREKVVLIFLIFLLNGIVVFYIIALGRLLCPNKDKVWSPGQVALHQGDDDFYVSHHGSVYDISKFWKLDHSDNNIETTRDRMQPFAGQNMDRYIVPPLTVACPGLVDDVTVILLPNETVTSPEAVHVSGPRYQADPTTKLNKITWYGSRFLPRMKEFYKGDVVISRKTVAKEGEDDNHEWFIIDDTVYDLTDYFHTQKVQNDLPAYSFLPPNVENLIKKSPGLDISEDFGKFNRSTRVTTKNCLDQMFKVGKTDFREKPRCKAEGWLLLAFTIILCVVIGIKFLAALQLGSKHRPVAQDKFVICQVPAYTEGEDQLRKALDSITALEYDNKRKLMCVICDGMIVGKGNDRPTPKIVLDILGVDPRIDPPALPFKAVGPGSEQLNYGKVYSGLYEYEGNVVPYLVVVKVGKESEQGKSKPGNRGKRDSQILLMGFLNRVHHRAPMSPLELEMFHQINNVIGVDPELYEFLLMVDADTSVKEDSLNRLVAACANDAKIAGICGETSLENEERSWWTMIQVYEYYISHHLAKAFESLFGSVTCLPGCFCMYRLRTADKGKPLVISDQVLDEYSDCNVDTLHKKNLLSLGEDRYLTTLMTKHFPSMSYKFIPDAYAQTAAPETWSILLSQRRRWINSTIHNLFELVFLKDLCGFCCFSMRFVVFIDLFGTIVLPATCAYLGYLIYTVASRKGGQFPLFSLVILAAVYGLQAVIFIIKRQWQHIGWMIIYIIAFPIYSFVLPIYSFWKQDDFSWGNTRVVIGEKGSKQVVAVQDETFDPRSIPLQKWDDYAWANNLPGRRGMANASEKGQHDRYDDNGYEMDDIRSVYSSVHPASTIHTGFPLQTPPAMTYMPPQSQMAYPGGVAAARQSGYSQFSPYEDGAQDRMSRHLSMGNLSDQLSYGNWQNPAGFPSSDNLLAMQQHQLQQQQLQLQLQQQQHQRSSTSLPRVRSGFGFGGVAGAGAMSRPVSTVNFQNAVTGPTDETIVEAIQACLREVDMDNVTKKQLMALTEQRLQTQLTGERKAFLDLHIDSELANM